MSGKPKTPSEIRQMQTAAPIPGVVFDVFNEMLARGAGIRSVTILQKDVERELVQRGVDVSEAFKKHWLDVEASYEVAGWRVAFDKPGYNESYDASWTFTPGEKAAKR